MTFGFRGHTDNSVSYPAASEREAETHGAVCGGRGSLSKGGVFHRHTRAG